MATKIGDLFFDVYADVSRAAKSVDDLTGKFAAAGSAASKAIGETIANAVGIAVGATAALTAATVGLGISYNTLGQSATAAFSSIYGDISAANEILQQISTLDLETPFSGKALTATARTLAGFDFQLGDVVDTTQALAQATAAMGLGSDALHRMAIAFGQIQSRGKLAGDEARQLANYGIDAYGLLADKLGITTAAVRELGQAGELTADVVIPALVESIETRFAGATEALFNTAAGQAEGLRSVFEAVGSALVEPFIGFAGGGAVVEAMGAVREELVDLVSVAEDGSFRLQGFLAPLTPVLEQLADGIRAGGFALADFLGGIENSALSEFAANFEGLGPVIIGVGAGLTTIFAQAIPFIGRFVAGFNPIVVGLTALAFASDDIRTSLVSTFTRIWEAVQPLIPGTRELVAHLMDLAEGAVPIVLEVIADAFENLAPFVRDVIDQVNALLPILSPVLVEVLQAVADALSIVLDLIGLLPPELVILTGALYALTRVFPLITLGIAMNMSITSVATGVSMLTLALQTLVPAIAAAAAAWGAFQAIRAGVTGDLDWLNRDVTLFEKPFQLAGRFGFALGGGDREQVARTAEINRLLDEGEVIGENFAKSMRDSGMSMDDFGDAARAALPTQEAINFALIEYMGILDEVEAARKIAIQSLFNERAKYDDVGEGIANAVGAQQTYQDSLMEEIELLDELEKAANAAWTEVDRLSRAGADATVDDFLRSLPDAAIGLTEALVGTAGVLRDLEVSGALESVQQDATKVINVLSREYGMSMEEIKSYFDERGLAGVISALGTITEETTETIDPLVAKYASLGATASQLRDAIDVLETRRESGLRAEIDSVENALEGARNAAEEARKAVTDFLSGGYLDSPQQAADELIGNIGSLGSEIEDALRLGGVRGEAALRQALGGVSSGIAEVVNAGLEAGLSGADIVALLGPLQSALGEETAEAARRIVNQDWEAGFTPKAADEIRGMLAGVLDPNAIQALIAGMAGADARVEGLENRLEGLRAALSAEVEFSPAQVQEALSAIETTVSTKPVVTPEAAQLIYDAIQAVFDDEDLQAAVDKAVIVQDILDAAQQAEDEVSLVFKSGLSFDTEELYTLGKMVSDEFSRGFSDRLAELRDEAARREGFDSFFAMQSALGPAVANATIGVPPTITTNLFNDIAITEAGSPRATASEVIAASSAAAGAGVYDPSKFANRGTLNPRLS